MPEEEKMKSLLLRTFCSMILCVFMIFLKFVMKEEEIVEEVYNYIATDIVFLK